MYKRNSPRSKNLFTRCTYTHVFAESRRTRRGEKKNTKFGHIAASFFRRENDKHLHLSYDPGTYISADYRDERRKKVGKRRYRLEHGPPRENKSRRYTIGSHAFRAIVISATSSSETGDAVPANARQDDHVVRARYDIVLWISRVCLRGEETRRGLSRVNTTFQNFSKAARRRLCLPDASSGAS